MEDLDGYASWPAWKAKRDTMRPVAGVLKSHEADDAFARAMADLVVKVAELTYTFGGQ